MEAETLEFLAAAGLAVNRSNPRQYRARVKSLPGTEVLFQRAADIFAKVAEGSVDLGVTGYDIVREHQREDDETIIVHPELGYGQCSLVLAVPDSWIDVTSMADLAEVSWDKRASGSELRIATKYVNLTREFLYDHGITYFQLVESSGALEAAPALNYADVISDLMTSGITLRENRLKTVAGGTVLQSQACLIGNRRLLRQDARKLQVCRGLLELIEAYLRSREYLSLTANIRGDSAEAVARQINAHPEIAGLSGPTVAPVYPKAGEAAEWFEVTVIVQHDLLLRAVDMLRRAGADNVTATGLRYTFDSKCWSFEALRRQLEGGRSQVGAARDRSAVRRDGVPAAAGASERHGDA
jgi:ATP phosphoribosyltransferase